MDVEPPAKPLDQPAKDPASQPWMLEVSGAHLWLERHAGWLTLLTALIFAATLVVVTFGDEPLWAPLLALGAFLLSVILLFTRPLEIESDINTIFRFAWGFAVAVAIFGLLFTYFGFDRSRVGENKKSEVRCEQGKCTAATDSEPLARKPYLIAIVPGCDYDSIPFVNGVMPLAGASGETSAKGTAVSSIRGASGRLTNPGMPEHIYCGELPPQWVLSIGGSILNCHFDGTCPKVSPRPDIPKLEADYEKLNKKLAAERTRLNEATRRIRAREGFALARLDLPEVPPGDYAADRDEAAKEIAELTNQVRLAQASLEAARKWDQLRWNIEGGPIVGGVVIPIYFLAIAILGALVNMTRKLPEFQQRVDRDYPKEFARRAEAGEGPLPPITWPYARDLVVFQILQVLTASAVAILAYSWAAPEQISTTVILAFAAGFSSEVFLVAIRGVIDRAIGLGPRPALARAMVQAQGPAKDPVPPRGSASTTPQSSGGFKVGNRVILVKPVGPFLPGTIGVVMSIEPGGELIVSTTADHTGMPVQFRLQSQPPESFRHASDDATPTDGPAG